VNVNAIVPGYAETDNTRAPREDPARYTAVLDRIPAGCRAWLARTIRYP
jgi:2-deoxy-D-gluconate 3-dehydrogenase